MLLKRFPDSSVSSAKSRVPNASCSCDVGITDISADDGEDKLFICSIGCWAFLVRLGKLDEILDDRRYI